MPTLRSIQVEVARYDGRYVVDVVLPALATAGFDAPVALRLEEPTLHHGSAETAAVLVEGPTLLLEAVLAGKAPRGDADRLRLSGRLADLRSLVRALRPPAPAQRGPSREVGAEATAPGARRKRDRVRTAEGRYIKGVVLDAPPDDGLPTPRRTAVLVDARAAPVDRLSFALQNLAAFLDVNLALAPDTGDDELVVITGRGLKRE